MVSPADNLATLSRLSGGMKPVADGNFQKYFGMLLAATAAAGVGFNVGLAGYYRLRRQKGEHVPTSWKLVPLLLLVPCVVHFVGFQRYIAKAIVQNEAIVN